MVFIIISLQKDLQIIEFHHQNQCSFKNVFRTLWSFYGRHSHATEQASEALVTKYRPDFTLLDKEENIGAIAEDRDLSIHRRLQQLGLYSTTWKILRKDFSFKAYKIQLV